MSFIRKISASFFANVAYMTLGFFGWKYRTFEANLEFVSQGTCQKNTGTDSTFSKISPPVLYKKMLKNLTRHVGELLFNFDTYKDLPIDCDSYPHQKNKCIFGLADGTAPVIEKMRKGGIFLTAHYGNYEASGAWLCALGVPLKASFIPLKPKRLNKFVYEKVRCVKGRPYSINAKSPRDFLGQLDGTAPDTLGQKQLFCLLADQDSRIASAIDGTFLGQSVKLNPLPDFLLKHRPDTPVFFCWIEELGEKRKILHAVEAPHRDGITDSIVDGPYRKWLEERIHEDPALWYGWTHRRFRSKHPDIYH